MRAKMQVSAVTGGPGAENLEFNAVCGKEAFGQNGESEDNSYARWTPTATLRMSITNPNLIGKFQVGQKFYLDFTEATE